MRSDSNKTHRSTEDDPLPGGHSFFEGPLEVVLRYQDSEGLSRYLSIDPVPEIRPPDTAVVGENQLRFSTEARLGIWGGDGGWLVIAWSTSDAMRTAQEKLIASAEGSTEPLRWLTMARVAMYWSLSGEPCKTSIRIGKGSMESFSSNLKHRLTPKRYPSAYRSKGDLVQVWVPL